MPLVLMVVHPDDDVAARWLQLLHGAGHVAQRVAVDALPTRPSLLDGLWVPARLPAAEVEGLRRWAGPQVALKLRDDDDDLDPTWLAELARTSRVVQIGPASVDLRRGLLQRGQHVETLTDIESALLAWMAQQPGHIFSRQELLEAVWGYSAKMQTRVVDVTVARVRAKLEPEPSRPTSLITVRGKGYRLDGVVAPEVGPAAAGGAPAADLFGRGETWSVVQEWLAAGEAVITLLGPPGVGKTRLAREVAEGRKDVAWCELGSADSERGALVVVATALGLPPDSPEAEVARALDACTHLVVLDNAEHVHALVARLVAGKRTSTILVTSRLRLAVPRERCLDLGPLAPEDAEALFLERARRHRSDVAIDPEALAAVVAACEGLPLALEIAAAQVRVYSGRDLARVWTSRSAQDRSQRLGHRSYHEALSSSWSLLSSEERHGLSVLARLRGPVPASLFDRLLDDGLGVLQGLHDASLVHIDPRPRGSMVRLLETVRRFVHDTASLAPDGALTVAERLADHTEGLHAETCGDDAWHALHQLGDVRRAVHDAVRWAVEAGRMELATRLALSLRHRLEVWGPTRADVEMLEALPEHAAVQRMLARSLPQVGRLDDALACADRAIALADTQEATAEGIYVRTAARHRRGELHPGPLEFALDVLSGLAAARAHLTLSRLATDRADLDGADAHVRSALALADGQRAPWLAAEVMAAAATVHDLRGEHGLASTRGQEALAAYEAHGVPGRIFLLRSVVAASLVRAGRPEDGKGLLHEAIQACERRGQLQDQVPLLQALVQACLETGDVDDAEVALHDALRGHGGEGLADDVNQGFRGQIAMARGRFAAASEHWDPLRASQRQESRRDAAYYGTLCALALGEDGQAQGWAAHPDAPDVLLHLVGVGRSTPPTVLPPTARDAERAWSYILGGSERPITPRGQAMVAAAEEGTVAPFAEVQALVAMNALRRAHPITAADPGDA